MLTNSHADPRISPWKRARSTLGVSFADSTHLQALGLWVPHMNESANHCTLQLMHGTINPLISTSPVCLESQIHPRTSLMTLTKNILFQSGMQVLVMPIMDKSGTTPGSEFPPYKQRTDFFRLLAGMSPDLIEKFSASSIESPVDSAAVEGSFY